MKILVICDGLFRGGLAKVVLAWIGGLSARGHVVGLALLNPQKDYPLPPLAWEAEFPERAPKGGLVRWRHRARWTAFIRESITRFEQQHGEADLVIAAGEECLRCAAPVEHRNLWISSHSSQLQSPKGEGAWARLRYRIKIWRRGMRLRALLDGRNMHMISEGQARELTEVLGVLPGRMKVIANPFDLESIRAQAAQSTPQSLAQSQPFIIGIGEFNTRKAFERLVDAFARCKFAGDLVLVGQGEARKALERQANTLGIARRVKFVPFHDNHYALLRKAKLLVSTSRSEGFGNVLVEALILGVPALSVDCPHGPKDILLPICSDALIPPDRLELLPERIDRFVAQPYAIEPQHLQRFTRDFVLDQYLSLIGQL